MKLLWVACLLVVCIGCSGAQRPDPEAVSKAVHALEAGELDIARNYAESAVRATPEDAEARKVLAAVHRAIGERAAVSGAFGRACDAYVRAAEREPFRRQRAQDYRQAYDNALLAGRERATAAEYLVASLDAEPNNLEVRRLAAHAYDELGQAQRAIEHYLYVWEADRSEIGIGLRLGLLYGATGASRDAEAVFRRVLEREPGNVPAHLHLADLYERAGQSGRARTLYETLIEAHPNNPSVLLRYADFLERTGDARAASRARSDAEALMPGVDRRKMRKLKSKRK